MKKIISLFVLSLLSLLLFTNVATARMQHVVDDAYLLNDYEISLLENKIETLRAEYQIDFVIYTTDRYYDDFVGYDAADFYDYNGYGIGDQYDGVMLYVNMANREFFVLTTGDFTKACLTDYAIDEMNTVIGNKLSIGDYYEAFDTFLDYSAYYIDYALEHNRAYDSDININHSSNEGYREEKMTNSAAYGLIFGSLASVATGVGLKSQMKSVYRQRNASDYADKKYGYCKANITNSRDIFLYRTVTHTHIPKSSPTGGGSTSFRSSSGRSHGGRGGKF